MNHVVRAPQGIALLRLAPCCACSLEPPCFLMTALAVVQPASAAAHKPRTQLSRKSVEPRQVVQAYLCAQRLSP